MSNLSYFIINDATFAKFYTETNLIRAADLIRAVRLKKFMTHL